ncbi:MAG: hypothetical protein Q8J68_07875 [Methanolobus sp.]|uniref:hypothetical protein n=1 Tax=Methanolobus sp. TaxID=1874737 RepID=UPI00272FDB0D|nr:hypothetical protein [Methanolobus sp.]MDP2217186.1 hypothetical protein [Methanolobus sp.]
MTLEHNEPEGTWIPLCDLCNWKGETHPEQGKAQAEYQRHCKTPEHKKNKQNAADEALGGAGRGETPLGEEKQPPKLIEKESMFGAPAIETLSEEETVLFYGEEGIQKLKRVKLDKLLTIMPKMSSNIKTWVMTQYDQDNAAQTDYNALYMLLISSQIDPRFAQRVVQNVITLEQKLRALLQQRLQQNTPFFSPLQPQGGQPNAQPFFVVTPEGRIQQMPQFFNPTNTGAPNPSPGGLVFMQPQPKEDLRMERVEKAIEGLAAKIETLQKPEPKEEKDVEEMIEEAVFKATEKPQISKEDVSEIVTKAIQNQITEKERESSMNRLTSAMETLSGEVRELKHRPPSAPMPKNISEEGSLEGKKLDIIGSKLGDIHDTTKIALGYLMGPEGKPPAKRTGKDLTELDENLEKIAQTV